MKNCNSCGLPETYETFEFDNKQVCNVCTQHKTKNLKVNWEERKKIFQSIIDQFRGKGDYDCIVPFSGGKDSTWQTYVMKKIHNLRTLAVTFDQFDQTDIGQENLEELKSIGVDHIHFSLNPNIIRNLVLKKIF